MKFCDFSFDNVEHIKIMLKNLPQGFLVLLILTVFVNTGMGVVIPILPNLITETTNNVATLGVPFFTLIMFRLLSKPMAGFIIGIIGAKYVLQLMYVLFGTAFCLYTFADSLTMFSAIRAVEGMAEGIAAVVLVEAALVLTKGRIDSGKLMGLFSSSFGLGFILGPALGSLLYAMFGKNSMFYFGVAVSVIGFTLVLFLPTIAMKTAKDQKEKMGIYNFWHHSNQYFISFIPQVMRRVTFFSLMIVMPLYAIDVLELDVKHIGWVFALSACITTFLMPLFGSLADKYNPVNIVAFNLMVMGGSFFFIGVFNTALPFVLLIVIETVAFSAMLPAGMKVFGVHMSNESKRPEIMGLFGSYIEIITLFLAVLLPVLYSINPRITWATLSVICFASALLFYSKRSKLVSNEAKA